MSPALSTEVSTVLGLGSLLMTCLLLIVYRSKKRLCFNWTGNCSCCYKATMPNKKRISKELVKAFSYEDELGGALSDCEEDVMRHLQQHPERKYDTNYKHNYLGGDRGGGDCSTTNGIDDCIGMSVDQHESKKLLEYAKPDIFEAEVDTRGHKSMISGAQHQYHHQMRCSIQRQHSVCSDGLDSDSNTSSIEQFKQIRPRNILKQQAIYTSIALKNNSKTLENLISNNKDVKRLNNDLSLHTEKGHISKQFSIDGSVSSDDSSLSLEKKTLLRRLKASSGDTESKDGSCGNKYQILNSFMDTYESDTQSSNLPDFSPNTTLSESNLSTQEFKYGRLEIGFAYDPPSQRLFIHVIQATDIPKEFTDRNKIGVSQMYVQVHLLPGSSQKVKSKNRFKTKSKPMFCPFFREHFVVNQISPESIMAKSLLFQLFIRSFARKTQLMGEADVLFDNYKPQQQETKLWLTLEPHKQNSPGSDLCTTLSRTDSTASSNSLHNQPELLLGLAYNGTTGRLTVSVMQGSLFRGKNGRAPDVFVKLMLLSSHSYEMARCKTSVYRNQPNPHFRETFIFQVALFQLPDVTLDLHVYNRKAIKGKEFIGRVSFGFKSSGDEETTHWNEMRDFNGEAVCRWHTLQRVQAYYA